MVDNGLSYIAFISYNHEDVKWAKWLRRRLEWYRLPAEINNDFSDSRYMRPVFRDRDTLTSGILNDSIKQNLNTSKYLVVVCSPHAAQSQWVSVEVQAFIDMGRVDRIIPFIVDGRPYNYTNTDVQQPQTDECFPLALRQWNLEYTDKTLLGIAVEDDGKTNRNKAFIRLVARILELDFDALWQRHKRFVRRLTALLCTFAISILILAYWFMIPVKLSVTVCDEPCTLPGMEQGALKFNDSEYSLSVLDTTVELNTLPGCYRLRTVPMSFHADRFYEDETQIIKVTAGVCQQVVLQLHRDSTFTVYAGTVYDGDAANYESCPISRAVVTVGDKVDTTDLYGRFHISFPLSAQSETKALKISHIDYQTYIREDESPGNSGMYLLYRR